MRTAIDEAKSAICKAQNDMKRYYDQRKTLAPVFKPSDKVFLNTLDIQTTYPSQKLSHRQLGPFVVEQWIGPMAYCLRLPHQMKQLHLVFNVVKLTPAPDDPIADWKTEDHPLCHDLANWLSHYLYFFSFLFLFTTTRWSTGKYHVTLSQCHNGVMEGHRWSQSQ